MRSLASLPHSHAARSRLRLLPGARAMEAALLEDLEALLPPGRLPLDALARPLRLLVPGRSLRLHLAATLPRARGGALVGLSIGTLQALALEILDRAGEPPPGSASAFDVLVRRFAREEAPLSVALEPLEDGYAAVTGAVRDLVDAGLDPETLEAAEELLDGLSPERVPPDQRERARSLLRVAVATLDEMERLDIGRAGALYARAAEALRRDPEGLLPLSGLLVYGFAELPGCALDFLEALVKASPSLIYVDQPRDPAHPERPDIGVAVTERLVERLRGWAEDDPAPAPLAPPPRLSLFRAAGATEEAREVAHRVRALLDRGVEPERIGVVTRDLGAYRVPLRTHLSRLGVPFSGVGALAPPGGMGRRIHAMLELLREREATGMDRWLDALGPRGRVGQRAVQPRRWRPVRLWDLRLGLRALGATDLADVAALDVERVLAGRDSWLLPVRQGVWEVSAEDEEAGADADAEAEDGEERVVQGGRRVVLSRRKLSGDLLRTAAQAAAALVARFRAWPPVASLQVHRGHLESLLKEELGWDQDYLGMPPVFGALSALEREFPRGFPLGLDELVLLVGRTLYDIGAGPIGGEGGGVAVLAAGEARGRTFSHLFLLGLNRDVFPKIVNEDPLFPDAVRRPLRALLGELPLRQDAFDQERYLFASLVASSPELTLSWQAVNDDNRPRPPSPLVERLRWAAGAEGASGEGPPERVEVPLVEPLFSRGDRAAGAGRPLPVEDHVLLAALAHDRRAWRALLPLALAEVAGAAKGLVDPRAVARARGGVLDEVDPDLRSPEGRARAARLGPYYGLIGEQRETQDLRDAPIFVTTVERMGGCPWQVFLERLLRLEPPPDPLQELPGVDERMVGNTVHLVLERIVGEVLPTKGVQEALADVRDREPVRVPWPEPARLGALLEEAAREVLADAGFGLSGFVRALTDRAAEYLDAAREADWSEGPLEVLGAEVEGAVTVRDAAGRPREIRFKADRVDLDADGALRLTDYKTGRGDAATKTPAKRKEKLLRRVQEGQYLQAVVYAVAGGEETAQGRYLYLKPGLSTEQRESAVNAEEHPFVEAFEGAARTALAAWDRGSFFPRLVDPKDDHEPSRCKRCEVSQACLRGDSGARGRLTRWAESAMARDHAGEALAPEEQAALAIWTLGAASAGETGEGGAR